MNNYPQCIIGPAPTYQEAMGGFVPGMADFYRNPAAYTVEPFRIFGNLYYVGDQKVCMHLIDTGEGLILFDCGYGQTTSMIEDSIRKLGFDPADLKWIIVSHGHFDHFGSGNVLRARYGCQIAMSAVDTAWLRQNPRLALLHCGPCPEDPICWPDRELQDGDLLTCGSTSIRCVAAPGHTYGTLAFFFDAVDGTERKSVGYWGGAGFLTMYGDYCREYGLPVGKDHAMVQTLKLLAREKPEITLGNHPGQNATLEKRRWMLTNPGRNPFTDPETWPALLHAMEEALAAFMEQGYGR